MLSLTFTHLHLELPPDLKRQNKSFKIFKGHGVGIYLVMTVGLGFVNVVSETCVPTMLAISLPSQTRGPLPVTKNL